MIIVALDTATPATTVAVCRDGEILAERSIIDARRHAELLTPSIQAVLSDARVALSQVTDIAVGIGPGAFTGLRVGLVTARALADALDVDIHGVVTLDVLARASGLQEPFAVVSDARRREVFWGRYSGEAIRVEGPFVGAPVEVADHLDGIPVVGAGATPFSDLFADIRSPELPAAGALALQAWAALVAGRRLLPAEPMYLRRPDVTPAATQKSVLS